MDLGSKLARRMRKKGLLGMKKVAELLGVTRATAYGLVASGQLPHIRVANAVRVLPSDLAAFMTLSRTQGKR
jgi:excisionase family DNA binding protein